MLHNRTEGVPFTINPTMELDPTLEKVERAEGHVHVAAALGSDPSTWTQRAVDAHMRAKGDKINSSCSPTQGWQEIHSTFKKRDDAIIKDYENEMDTLLVFAGLFSAVLTAFIVEAYARLDVDNTELSALLLERISQQLSGLSIEADKSSQAMHAPSVAIVAVNILWFLSLLLGLFTALFAILVKQWTHVYSKWSEGVHPDGMIALRDFYRASFDKWHVSDIVALLPVVLQLSLLLFIVGLVVFLWTLNVTVAAVITALALIMVLTAVISIVLPTFSLSCPYKSPLGFLLVTLRNRSSSLDLPQATQLYTHTTRASNWREYDIARISYQKQSLRDPVDYILSNVALLLDIRPVSSLERILDKDQLEGSVVAFRINELREPAIELLSKFIVDPALEFNARGFWPHNKHAARLRHLAGFLNRSRGGLVVNAISSVVGRDDHPDTTIATTVRSALSTSNHIRNILPPSDIDGICFSMKALSHAGALLSDDLVAHPERVPPSEYNRLLEHLSHWLELAHEHHIPSDVLTHGKQVLLRLFGARRSARVSSLTLRGHEHQVTAVAFSPDGQWVASAARDHTVRVWDTVKGECLGVLDARTSGRIVTLTWSADGLRLVAHGGAVHAESSWTYDLSRLLPSSMSREDKRESSVAPIFSLDAEGRWLLAAQRLGGEPSPVYRVPNGRFWLSLHASSRFRVALGNDSEPGRVTIVDCSRVFE